MRARLRYLPISIFSIVLGLSGYAIATERIFAQQGWPAATPQAIAFGTTIVYAGLLGLYLLKLVSHRDAVAAEFRHPVMVNFFPAITISLLLLSIAYADIDTTVSSSLWWAGMPLNLLLTVAVLSTWLRHTRFEIDHFSPAWFIPVVGNLLVPVVGVQHGPADVSWFFFAIGLVFAIALFVVFLYRMIFHTPLHDRHLPTLFIIIAPPAVGAVSYVKLTGELDAFARILYFLAVFFALFLAAHLPLFWRLRFYLSWWAYAFPLAALTIATFLVGKETGGGLYLTAAVALWVGVSALVAALAGRTILAVSRHEICVPEGGTPQPSEGSS